MNTENDRKLRVVLVKKMNYRGYINPESLTEVLRPFLRWETVTEDEYQALIYNLKNKPDWVVLRDSLNDDKLMPMDTMDEALAWVEVERQKKERATLSKTKKKPKRLTAKQLRDLEALREELGVSHEKV